MPSYHGNRIIRLIESALDTELTTEQKLKCEELLANVYRSAVYNFVQVQIRRYKRKNKPLTFDHFYQPLASGITVGAMKYPKGQRFKFDSPNRKVIYAEMHTYLGTDFSQGELEDIVWLTQHATPQEVQTAINVAQYHGVVNAAYVRAILVGNRRRAAAALRVKDARFAKITEDPPNVYVGVPHVKSLQQSWVKKLKYAVEQEEIATMESATKRKLKIQGRP